MSVIIPTLNEAGVVTRLLDDLRAQTLPPAEVIVVDAMSGDRTAEQVGEYPEVRLMRDVPPVGGQRTRGGMAATGDVLVFADADVRMAPDFLERLVGGLESRRLGVACPWYWPYRSTLAIRAIYAAFGLVFFLLQGLAPSGAGSCIAVRRELFRACGGFTAGLTFDDIAFIRAAARRGRFATLPVRVFVSDRRFRRYGVLPTLGKYIALTPFFALSLFGAANIIEYPFGDYKGTDPK